MNDENDKPKIEPEEDWAITDPGVKTRQNVSPEGDAESAPPVQIPKEETGEKKWEMPEPVFRVSEGTKASADKPKTQPQLTADSYPDFEEIKTKLADEPPISAPKKKSTKLPLIVGGLFFMFLFGIGFLLGAYFLFLKRPDVASVANVEKNENTSSNSPSNFPTTVSATPDLPPSIDYKGEMILVPAGEFTMGSDAGEDVSRPAHKVTLPAFYIDKFEVTNAQYKEFCDAKQRLYPRNQDWDENYFLSRPNAPVIGVSFEDAREYAAWAGKRLPTEAEWEKAASWDEATKSKREFPWGNEFGVGNAAFNLSKPSDVGMFFSGASPFGVMDMAGNAFEWVDAFFKPYPKSTAQSFQFGEKNRIVRGGYFGSETIDYLKTTTRVYALPETITNEKRDSYIGFRCAISADDALLKTNGK